MSSDSSQTWSEGSGFDVDLHGREFDWQGVQHRLTPLSNPDSQAADHRPFVSDTTVGHGSLTTSVPESSTDALRNALSVFSVGLDHSIGHFDRVQGQGAELPGWANEQRAIAVDSTSFGASDSNHNELANENWGRVGVTFDTPFSMGADMWDSQINQARRASDTLRAQLDEYVDEGGNWAIAALGATGLDLAGYAMTFTQGLADTGRLGQGIGKGTSEGVFEDLERALNVAPAWKILRILGVSLDVANVIESAAQKDTKGVMLGLAGGALSGVAASKRLSKSHSSNSVTQSGKRAKKSQDSDGPRRPRINANDRMYRLIVSQLAAVIDNRKTIALIRAKKDGEWHYFLVSSEPKVRRQVEELAPGVTSLRGPGNRPDNPSNKNHPDYTSYHHAEQAGVAALLSVTIGKKLGNGAFTNISIYPSKKACPHCMNLQQMGYRIINPE